jgi:hypothetical protein
MGKYIYWDVDGSRASGGEFYFEAGDSGSAVEHAQSALAEQIALADLRRSWTPMVT